MGNNLGAERGRPVKCQLNLFQTQREGGGAEIVKDLSFCLREYMEMLGDMQTAGIFGLVAVSWEKYSNLGQSQEGTRLLRKR